jgi:hypothetical protein
VQNTLNYLFMAEAIVVDLLERDVVCVWTERDPSLGEGMHIIHHRQGPEVSSTILTR